MLLNTFNAPCLRRKFCFKLFVSFRSFETQVLTDEKKNVFYFLDDLKNKLNLRTFDDWNSITKKDIHSNGGNLILKQYSLFELKCLGYPEGNFIKPKPPGYWKDNNNILKFLEELKEKYNLQTKEDWNKITTKDIQLNGGFTLLNKFSLSDLKNMGFPDGESDYNFIPSKSAKFWNNIQNVHQFLDKLKQKYNLQTAKDWNKISIKQIQLLGGSKLFPKYTLYDLKCMGFPEGESLYNKRRSFGFWDDSENIKKFLNSLQQKYSLKTAEDWNSVTQNQIKLHGGRTLLLKYSLYDLKCLGFPEGKSIFDKRQQVGYWDDIENVHKFLKEIQAKFNLQTPEDWNSLTASQIQNNGGGTIINKYSMYDLKCMGCSEGYSIYNKRQTSGYWNDMKNIYQFLEEIKIKYNLNNVDDWNSLTIKQIISHGGNSLLTKFSMYDLKCMGYSEGKVKFVKPIQSKPAGYWENEQNILRFLEKIKQIYNLQTSDDWNSITQKQIKFNGGGRLLNKFSLYDLKCLGFPEGKSKFDKRLRLGYWDNEQNRNNFIQKLKSKFNLQTPKDWKRLSVRQIKLQGGEWLFYNNMEHFRNIKITFPDDTSYSLQELLISDGKAKRSSQRWLFLQIQKLFPNEEIVEDYFHSDISRESGRSVQFDIFFIKKNIAIEYHGKQHYEDIPTGFGSLEMNQNRDLEKEKLCKKYGIQIIVIPYWWDNKLESLRETLLSSLKNEELKHKVK